MKILRPALIAAILTCFAAGAAFANNIHVVFDPVPIPAGTFGIVTDASAIYTVNWEGCSSQGIPSAFAGDDACIALLNETGTNLDHLNLSFTVTSALVGDTLDCAPLDGFLSSNDCSSSPGPFTLGEVVSVNFFGGLSIPNYTAFFFGETGVALSDIPPVNITAPEPTSLSLLAAGMGLIGLCLVFVKR